MLKIINLLKETQIPRIIEPHLKCINGSTLVIYLSMHTYDPKAHIIPFLFSDTSACFQPSPSPSSKANTNNKIRYMPH